MCILCGAVLSCFYELSPLISITLGGGYYAHFTDEKTKGGPQELSGFQ